MLKITLHDSAGELRFRLEGRLGGPWVGELRQCWVTAKSTAEGRKTTVDLGEVDYVDSDGQALLSEMYRSGVALRARTPLIQEVVRDIERGGRYDTVEGASAHSPDVVVSDAHATDSVTSHRRAL